MQRITSRAPSSSPLAVSVGDANSCSPVSIGWDASAGKGPWTVMVAPINKIPVSISIPDASGSSFRYDWTAPLFSSGSSTQAFIAVADSTGSYSGVSSQFSIGPSTKTCGAPLDSLDFVWYPTQTNGTPEQCTDWAITYQKDDQDNGIEGQVSFTFLPEKGTPITVSAGTSTAKGGKFQYTIPWDENTKFAVIANDEGKSGTGGVGDLYTVEAGGKKAAKSCKASGNIGNGLPAPTSTFRAASTAKPSSSASKSVSGSNGAGTATGLGSSGAATDNDTSTQSSEKSGSSHAGAAVGATFGVLAVIALVVGLLWWLKRRNSGEGAGRDEKKHGPEDQAISPWRWSSSPFDEPVTNSRASNWLRKGAMAPSKGFRVLGDRPGHGSANSISTSIKAPFTNAHARNQSSHSQGGSAGMPSPQSPFLYNGKAPNFRDVVPDDALFPPPRPTKMADERSFSGRSTADSEQVGSPFANQGAGLGTYDSIALQETSQDRSTLQDHSLNSNYRTKTLLTSSQEQGTSPISNQYIGPIGPTKTSIYDPYTHLSHIWEDQDGVTREIQRAGDVPLSSHNSSVVTSEVMMPSSSSFPPSQSEEDRYSSHSAELPYL